MLVAMAAKQGRESSRLKRKYWRGLRALFPRHQLAADLATLGLSPTAAAVRASMQPCVVLPWVQGVAVPRAGTFRRLISALDIDPSPYQGFLESANSFVILVCPNCGRIRTMKKGLLKFAGRRVKNRRELRRRPDDRYERLCRPCSARAVGRHALRAVNQKALERHLPQEDTWVLEDDPATNNREIKRDRSRIVAAARAASMGGLATLTRNRQRFRQRAKAPKSPEHREAIARGYMIHAVLRRPFFLCPLCGLLVYGHHWHKPCAMRKLYWRRKNPKDGHGPEDLVGRVERYAARNYRWLIRRRAGGSRRELLDESRHELGPYRDRQRFKRRRSPKSTVTKAIEAFVRLLPGSWDLLFSVGGHTKHRRGNHILQELAPLPLELQSIIESGARDRLIQVLHSFGMPTAELIRVTGAGSERIRRVIGSIPKGN
jgi:hypothetical protein